MYKAIKKSILGEKAGTSKSMAPYSNIPIFDDVGSIGMPGMGMPAAASLSSESLLTKNLNMARTMEEEKTNGSSWAECSPPRPAQKSRKSGGLGTPGSKKRARENSNNINELKDNTGDFMDKENMVPKIPKASNIQMQRPDNVEKVEKKTVRIEESKNEYDNANESKDDEGVDSRFATGRSVAEKAALNMKNQNMNPTRDESKYQDDNDDDDDEEEEVDDHAVEERDQMREYMFSKVRHNHYQVVETMIKGNTHKLQVSLRFKGILLYTSGVLFNMELCVR